MKLPPKGGGEEKKKYIGNPMFSTAVSFREYSVYDERGFWYYSILEGGILKIVIQRNLYCIL